MFFWFSGAAARIASMWSPKIDFCAAMPSKRRLSSVTVWPLVSGRTMPFSANTAFHRVHGVFRLAEPMYGAQW